ncbi:MAG: GTP 3',8-cyclase MoaA [Desulfovibrio sp.]|nr:GTP 3',8-cyclase MoaA [Desulfovibrio sp.]
MINHEVDETLSQRTDPGLSDSFGRLVTYLRLSVTDRCNLRCLYCQSNAVQHFIPHANILHYEEMHRLVGILREMGLRKLRLTGGEPFMRKGCDRFLVMLRESYPELDVRITSNGTLLKKHIPLLRDVGIGAVNLSIDTFDPDTFASITGRHELPAVLDVLDDLLSYGIRVKLNAVAIKSVTEPSLPDFIRCAERLPVDVRFIEFMPMGEDTLWSRERFLGVDALFSAISQSVALTPLEEHDPLAGPARMYALEGGTGRIGFITALTNHFCARCNRLRLTSEGSLRLCLFDDSEVPLREHLRGGATDAEIARIIRNACRNKPMGYELLAKRNGAVAQRRMSGIGG